MKRKYLAVAILAMVLAVAVPFAVPGQALEYPQPDGNAATNGYSNKHAVCPTCGQVGHGIAKDRIFTRYLYECPYGHKWWGR